MGKSEHRALGRGMSTLEEEMEEQLIGLESIYGDAFSLDDADGDEDDHVSRGDRVEERQRGKDTHDSNGRRYFRISGVISGIDIKFGLEPCPGPDDGSCQRGLRCVLAGIWGCGLEHRERIEKEVANGNIIECFAIVEAARRILDGAIAEEKVEHEEEETHVKEEKVDSRPLCTGDDPTTHLGQASGTSLACITHDTMIKIISFLDLDTIQRVGLVCSSFALSIRQNDLWLALWARRWPGEGASEDSVSRECFHSRYAAECNLESLVEEETVLRVSRLEKEPADAAPISGIAWVGDGASHAAISAGSKIYVCSHAALLHGQAGMGGEECPRSRRSIEEEEDGLRWDEVPYLRRPRLSCVAEAQDSKVLCLSSSESGSTLAAGMGSGTIKVWDRVGDIGGAGGESMSCSRHHKASVTQVEVSERYRCVVASSLDSTLSVWRWETGGRAGGARGSVRRPSGSTMLRGHGSAINDMSVSRGRWGAGLTVASAAKNGTLKVWDCERGACVFSARNKSVGSKVLMANDWGGSSGDFLVAGLANGSVQMFDPRVHPSSALVCHMVRKYSHTLQNPRFTQDWALGSLQGHSSDFRSALDSAEAQGAANGSAVSHLCLTSWGLRLGVLDKSGTLSLFDLRSLGVSAKRSVGEETSHHARPTKQTAAAGGSRSAERYAEAFDWEAPSLFSRSQIFCDVVCRGGSCGMSADARKVVAGGAEDGRVCAVELKSGKVLRSLPGAMQVARGRWHTRDVSGLCTHMLWDDSKRRDTLLVGSSQGMLGACELHFRW